ncbi:Uncharacterised protein [Candidatus Anstonella stagnisolia]|nr:Uncharacterised protein [Candidatus Anstonella stagnisolia]
MKGQSTNNIIGGIALLALIVFIVLSQIRGQQICSDIPSPHPDSPSKWCDVSKFTKEYFNTSQGTSTDVRYNEISYRAVSVGSQTLPIRDSDCSLVVDAEEATKAIRSAKIYQSLNYVNPVIFKDACYCNAQSVGAHEACGVTTAINSILDNHAVELAAENDKATLNVVRAMAPAGYEVTMVKSGKVFLSAVNELKGGVPIGEAYQVIDTYSCSLSNLGGRIYDYSAVGTRLLSEMQQGTFYNGSGTALIRLISDFKNIKDTDSLGMTWNAVTSGLSDSNRCPLTFSEPKYSQPLDALSSSISYGTQSGETQASTYLSFIMPIKQTAEETRQRGTSAFSDYNSLGTLGTVLFRVHKLPLFFQSVGTYFQAENEFKSGLYLSSNRDYSDAMIKYNDWKQWGILGIILDIVLWLVAIILIVCVWFILKRKNGSYDN